MTSENFLWRTASESSEKRFRNLQRINESGSQEFEMSICADDPVYWLIWWAWTYDPRQRPALIPFDPFPKQVEFFGWLQGRETADQDGLVEKSRDAGVSWLCCAFATHRWLFRPGCSIGFG